MPDHFHWLVELKYNSLSALVLATKSRGARAVNVRLKRRGVVWQRGFHDRAIRREEDLQAGLVTRVHDYPLWDAKWL